MIAGSAPSERIPQCCSRQVHRTSGSDTATAARPGGSFLPVHLIYSGTRWEGTRQKMGKSCRLLTPIKIRGLQPVTTLVLCLMPDPETGSHDFPSPGDQSFCRVASIQGASIEIHLSFGPSNYICGDSIWTSVRK